MKHKEPTIEQKALAIKYRIPIEQAHTINISKARAYENDPKIRLNKFLDDLDEQRLKVEQKQEIKIGGSGTRPGDTIRRLAKAVWKGQNG